MPKRTVWVVVALLLITSSAVAGDPTEVNRGATETSPSRSEYFSWINNTNEGATEGQTLVNLAFFRWLHDEYRMELDIYVLGYDSEHMDLSPVVWLVPDATPRDGVIEGCGHGPSLHAHRS